MLDNTMSSASDPAQSSDAETPKPWPLHPPSLSDPSTYPKVSFESLRLRGTIPAEADGPIYFEGNRYIF